MKERYFRIAELIHASSHTERCEKKTLQVIQLFHILIGDILACLLQPSFLPFLSLSLSDIFSLFPHYLYFSYAFPFSCVSLCILSPPPHPNINMQRVSEMKNARRWVLNTRHSARVWLHQRYQFHKLRYLALTLHHFISHCTHSSGFSAVATVTWLPPGRHFSRAMAGDRRCPQSSFSLLSMTRSSYCTDGWGRVGRREMEVTCPLLSCTTDSLLLVN